MTPRVRSGGLPASIVIGLCAASCGRIGFDLLPQDSQQAVSSGAGGGVAGSTGSDATAGAPSNGGSSATGGVANGGATNGGAAGNGGSGGATGSAGSGGSGAASASGGAGGIQRDGATGTGAATGAGGASNGGASSGGAPATGGTGPDAGPPPVCGSTSGTLKVWSFDSTVESWQFWPDAGAGTLAWTTATGNPTAGALSLDVTSGTGRIGWIVMDAAAPNLTGHTGSVWLWLDTQTNGTVGVKMYAQSDIRKFAWADGGFVTLTPKAWTCVTINFSTPVYKDATFDPTNVVRFGVEVTGTGPLTLYTDQLAY